MKGILRTWSIVSSFAVSLVVAGEVQARQMCPPGFESLCSIKLENDFGKVVGAVVQTLIIIAIVVCLFFLIFGGMKYITAAGDQGKTQQARSTIIAAVVGLIIALAAFLIVNIVLYMFTGKGLSGLNVDFKL